MAKLTQKQLIRGALRQASSMNPNQKAYLKGATYNGRPVVVENSGRGGVVVTHAGRGGTVSHVLNNGRLINTSRDSYRDNRVFGETDTIRLHRRGKKPSTGHKSG